MTRRSIRWPRPFCRLWQRFSTATRSPRPAGRFSHGDAHLIPTDAHLGVPGRPQSATGQTAILTGVNAPARLGEHYGPRPDQRVRDILDEAGIFARLHAAGHATAFVNAYPQGYFDAVKRGKRLLSAVPYAARRGGLRLRTWREMVGAAGPVRKFHRPGLAHSSWAIQMSRSIRRRKPARSSGDSPSRSAFAFFEHWLTDFLGHYRDLGGAIENFERIDRFLAGLLDVMDWQQTLLISCQRSWQCRGLLDPQAHREQGLDHSRRQPGRGLCPARSPAGQLRRYRCRFSGRKRHRRRPITGPFQSDANHLLDR